MTLLTVKDIAARLQVREKTIYSWASQGKIPSLKIHGVIRFEENEIDEWLHRCHAPTKLALKPARNQRHGSRKEGINILVERAKRSVYNAPGGTRPIASPFGKEKENGTL